MGQIQSTTNTEIEKFQEKFHRQHIDYQNLKNIKNHEILELKESLYKTREMLKNVKEQHEQLHDKITIESIKVSENNMKLKSYEDYWLYLENENSSDDIIKKYMKDNNISYIDDSFEKEILLKFLKYICANKNSIK